MFLSDKFNGNNNGATRAFKPLVPNSTGQEDVVTNKELPDGIKSEAKRLFKALYQQSKEIKEKDKFALLYKEDVTKVNDPANKFKALYEGEPVPKRMPLPSSALPKPALKPVFEKGSEVSKDSGILMDQLDNLSKEDTASRQAALDAIERSKNIENLMQEEAIAKETARKEGFAKGEKDGFEKGLKEGEEKGFQEGLTRGNEEGNKEGQEKGHKEGSEKGYLDGIAKAKEQTDSLHQIILALNNLWVDMTKKNETKIIELITKIAERVVSGTVEVDRDVVKRAIFHVFEVMPDAIDVTIAVNPEDYEYVELVKEDFFKSFKELQSVSVNASPAVERGGCRVESKVGQVNSSIEERLLAVTKSVVEAGK